MLPRGGVQLPVLSGTAAGTKDPICPPQESEELRSSRCQCGIALGKHGTSITL